MSDVDSEWSDCTDSDTSSSTSLSIRAMNSTTKPHNRNRKERRNGINASRQKSPGPRLYAISKAGRKICFLEKERAPAPGLPIIRLDPFLERHVLRSRVHSGLCPQLQRRRGEQVSLVALKCGGLRGCPFCILGYFAVTAFYTETLRSNTPLYVHSYGYEGLQLCLGRTREFELYAIPNEVRDTIAFPERWPNAWELARSDERWSFYGTSVPAFPSRNSIPEDASSAQTAKTVLRWLHECNLTHSKCSIPRPKWYPTRLIDISAMQLCETQTWDTAEPSVPYVCLSHCWGSGSQASSVLRTTKATLASHREKILPEELPRTFLEAIEFTGTLGIPYLWIDSLCIVQDDKLDWEKEGAAMADIYMNCHVCLAAVLSPNSEGGLFARQSVRSCQVGTVRFLNGPSLPLYARERPIHDVRRSNYPLADRAWVVQETQLSPRTLYFIGTEIVFECQEEISCECGGVHELEKQKRLRQTTDGDWNWQTIVQLYTKTSLTFSRDTLPALSGLAKQWLSTHPHDVYLAGLWRSTLHRNLLWFSHTSLRRRARPWRAPSWSWASIDPMATSFNIPSQTEAPVVKIVDAHCTPSGANQTGTVAFGHLILRGKAFDASIHYWYAYDAMSRVKGDIVEWSEYDNDPDDPASVRINVGPCVLYCLLDIATWKPGQDHVEQGSRVKLLFLWGPDDAHATTYTHKESQWNILLLRPLFADTFERIGIVQSWESRNAGMQAPSVLSKVFNETPEADYFIV